MPQYMRHEIFRNETVLPDLSKLHNPSKPTDALITFGTMKPVIYGHWEITLKIGRKWQVAVQKRSLINM